MRSVRVWFIAAVALCALLRATPAHAAARITSQAPTKGPVGTLIRVEGNGCPPPDGGGPAGTFEVVNFTGVAFAFNAKPDGTFAFDYKVLPAEAGQQTPDSVYPTSLYCRSTDRAVAGPSFTITGPSFSLEPRGTFRGQTVRLTGVGCVQDGGPASAAVLLVAGVAVRSFNVGTDYRFETTFQVPGDLAENREHIVQINCLIQRLESAAGDGGQRALGAQVLLVEPAPPVTSVATTAPPTTLPEPVEESRRGVPVGLVAVVGVAALMLLVAAVVRIRRRPPVVATEADASPSYVRVDTPPLVLEPEPTWTEWDWAPEPDPEVVWTEWDWAPEPEPEVAWTEWDWAPEPDPEDVWTEWDWAPDPEPAVAWTEWDWAPDPESEPKPVLPERPRRSVPLRAARVYPDYADNDDVSIVDPPYAPRRPRELVAFGDVRVDNYYWLRDRENPEVIKYLEAENAYSDAYLAPLAGLRQQLFDTIKARTKEDDTSPPVPMRGWEYYVRTAEGAEYPDSCRRPRGGGDETVILNRNAMAEGHAYLSCLGPIVSPNDNRALYAVDFDGDERYTIKVRNLRTFEDLTDSLPGSSGNICWVNDDVFLYVMLDETHRPYQVRRHVIGSDPASDEIIYEDNDDRFFVHVGRDLAGRFVFVSSGSKLTTEDHFLAVDDPYGPLTVVEPRVNGVEYVTSDDGENFVILTNADAALDFKVVTAPVARPGRENWIELLPHRPGTRVNEVQPFKTFIAIGERREALNTIRIVNRDTGANFAMTYDEEVYDAQIDANAEFDTTTLRYTFTSLNTPLTWIDHNVATGAPTLVKRAAVLGVDLTNYVTVREWATAPDGEIIPISILHHRDFVRNSRAPGVLYGYGSYELSSDPNFSIARLNLVDRGLVWAIAHVRGGGEMGRGWYDDGKMLKKRNSFTDFIACANHLIDNGWVAAGRLAIRGGSAGGLLMGAVANMAPGLFNTVVAEVPFVDVVTTMSDETIPLTVTEWEEWGNPRDNADDYQYMKSYSPVDNVEEKEYPAIYVEAGLNDPRVQYWEPAKWVAKLRVTKTDDKPLLLKTEMGAGHGGPSGRYQAWDDEARVQAFILNQLKVDGQLEVDG